MKKSITIPLLICCLNLFSQQNLQWVNNFGTYNYDDEGEFVTVDSNGDIITIGKCDPFADFDPSSNITLAQGEQFIFKSDPYGYLKWVISYPNNSSIDIKGIDIDDSNNIYFISTFKGTQDFDPSSINYSLTSYDPNLYNACLVKLDSLGNFVWARRVGNPVDYTVSTDFKIKNDTIYWVGQYGGWLQLGSTYLQSKGNYDIFIIKMDLNGNFIWENSVGGTGNDHSYSIDVDLSGYIYLSGDANESFDFDPEITDYYLPVAGQTDFYVAKYSTDGSLIWAKMIGGDSYDNVYSIKLKKSNNLILCGHFRDTVDFDPNIGISNLYSDLYTTKRFILCIDTSGNFEWVKNVEFGFNSPFIGNFCETDIDGNIFIITDFTNTIDIDPSQDVFNLSSFGDKDIALIKLDSLGNLMYAEQFGGFGKDHSSSLKISSTNEIIITGSFSDVCYFTGGNISTQLTSSGNSDIFIIKLSDFVSINENPKLNFSLYPNPTASLFTITCNNNILSASVYDASGKLIISEMNLNTSIHSMELENLERGIYFVEVNAENGKAVIKVVKE